MNSNLCDFSLTKDIYVREICNKEIDTVNFNNKLTIFSCLETRETKLTSKAFFFFFWIKKRAVTYMEDGGPRETKWARL